MRYFRPPRRYGVTAAAIREALYDAGYTAEEIEEAANAWRKAFPLVTDNGGVNGT